jgi:hypothetical protein
VLASAVAVLMSLIFYIFEKINALE